MKTKKPNKTNNKQTNHRGGGGGGGFFVRRGMQEGGRREVHRKWRVASQTGWEGNEDWFVEICMSVAWPCGSTSGMAAPNCGNGAGDRRVTTREMVKNSNQPLCAAGSMCSIAAVSSREWTLVSFPDADDSRSWHWRHRVFRNACRVRACGKRLRAVDRDAGDFLGGGVAVARRCGPSMSFIPIVAKRTWADDVVMGGES